MTTYFRYCFPKMYHNYSVAVTRLQWQAKSNRMREAVPEESSGRQRLFEPADQHSLLRSAGLWRQSRGVRWLASDDVTNQLSALEDGVAVGDGRHWRNSGGHFWHFIGRNAVCDCSTDCGCRQRKGKGEIFRLNWAIHGSFSLSTAECKYIGLWLAWKELICFLSALLCLHLCSARLVADAQWWFLAGFHFGLLLCYCWCSRREKRKNHHQKKIGQNSNCDKYWTNPLIQTFSQWFWHFEQFGQSLDTMFT